MVPEVGGPPPPTLNFCYPILLAEIYEFTSKSTQLLLADETPPLNEIPLAFPLKFAYWYAFVKLLFEELSPAPAPPTPN